MEPTDREQVNERDHERNEAEARHHFQVSQLESALSDERELYRTLYKAHVSMETAYCTVTDRLQKKLDKKDTVIGELKKELLQKEKVETKLRVQMKEMKKKEEEMNDQLKEMKKKEEERNDQLKKLEEELSCHVGAIQEKQEKERECAEANKELEKQVEERDGDRQQLETIRNHGRIMEQENRVRESRNFIFNCNLNLFNVRGNNDS
jgi:chromosome segregation ATPase